MATLESDLIDELLKSETLDERQVKNVNKTKSELDCDFFTALQRLGYVGDDTLYQILSRVLHWPLIDKIKNCPTAHAILEGSKKYQLSIDWCIENHLFIETKSSGKVLFYCDSYRKYADLLSLSKSIGISAFDICLLTPAMAATVVDDVIRERAVSELLGELNTDLSALAEEAPVINLVNNIVERAIHSEASDIHIEPREKNFVVRFRVDGKLIEFMQQPSSRFPAIASRIKLLSQLDISERRLPQDGRFSFRAGKLEFDIRVSTAPDVHGESIVLRLLPKNRDELSLNTLGIDDDHLEMFKGWGALSNGIILVTGPTGSGKSTTLYALLSEIKTGEEKIVTVEDPVEYQLDGITQVQARPDIGYTFARALRTFLRQDPDVIMVGEIRDKETADIAVQSSLTGHLVVSTLHTNDASSVFPRLSDIGVETYLTAATVQGVQAQRLVRKLCTSCATEASPPEFLLSDSAMQRTLKVITQPKWKKAVGCEKCGGRGYRGRMGIYELIPMTSEIRQLVANRANAMEIRKMAREQGFRSLMEDGFRKAARGLTTIDEVLRVCSLEDED